MCSRRALNSASFSEESLARSSGVDDARGETWGLPEGRGIDENEASPLPKISSPSSREDLGVSYFVDLP